MSFVRATHLRGFTLVETIIVVALFTVMLFALFDFFINYNATYLHEEAVVKTASSAGALVNEVARMAAGAGQVLPSRTIDGVTYASGTSTLVLELPAVSASGAVVVGAYDYVAFYAEGASAYRVIEADGASTRTSGRKRLSDTLSSLLFTYDSPSFPDVTKVTIDVVTAVSIKASIVDQHLTQQVTLRNDAAL
jgi:Tfp pilus assembly protein FimT